MMIEFLNARIAATRVFAIYHGTEIAAFFVYCNQNTPTDFVCVF